MQNGLYRKRGVSPAYFISLFGTTFSSDQVFKQISMIKDMGFSAIQLEIFDVKMLEDWQLGGLLRVLDKLEKEDMLCSVFVAHFLGVQFTNKLYIKDKKYLSLLEKVLLMLKPLDKDIPLAIPLLPYESGLINEEQERAAMERLKEMIEITRSSGRDFLVEIVPGSLAGSYSHFMNSPLWDSLRGSVGFLLDTGHAHVTGENIPELINRMGLSLKALHLSDNGGVENNSFPPGTGDLIWSEILESLDNCGYTGSLDLEIVDKKDVLEEKYLQGLKYLEALI